MRESGPADVVSRDNPTLRRVRRVLADPAAYRRVGLLWLEGDHLLRAALARGVRPAEVWMPASRSGDAALRALVPAGVRCRTVDDRLWREHCTLESPPALAAVLTAPAPQAAQPGLPTVVLDRLQDAGNVGSILRSAAALGVRQVLALKGTAALWSPKVLRAGMGAHFALHLVEQIEADALGALGLPLLATSSHGGLPLHHAQWAAPAAWVFGHEGQGVHPDLLARCALTLQIPQPGGEESLNVAAAAAICLYEAARRGAAGGQ